MEEDYNWRLIFWVSLPISAAVAYAFYSNLSNSWKWFTLFCGILLSGGVVYAKNKRKSNIFTTIAIVLLAALIVKALKNFGAI